VTQTDTGNSLGLYTRTDAPAGHDLHSLFPDEPGPLATISTSYIRLVQSGNGFMPVTAGARLSRNQVILAPRAAVQPESALTNTGRASQPVQAPGTTQEEADTGKGQKRKRRIVPPGGCGPWHRSAFDSDGSPIHDTQLWLV